MGRRQRGNGTSTLLVLAVVLVAAYDLSFIPDATARSHPYSLPPCEPNPRSPPPAPPAVTQPPPSELSPPPPPRRRSPPRHGHGCPHRRHEDCPCRHREDCPCHYDVDDYDDCPPLP